jgi:cytochrome c
LIRLVTILALFVLAGCRGGVTERAYMTYTGGNAQQGRQTILNRNCGACHTIPGVRNAVGMVGPPLVSFARRTFIAGRLPNSPENLQQWLSNPQKVDPGNAMPDLGLRPQEIQDVSAYLYALR